MDKSNGHSILIGLLLALLLFGIVSCSGLIGKPGRDGVDGKAYIKYTWLFGPFSYTTSDPGIPATGLISGNYYQTTAGTYSFVYVAWDGSTWSGFYSIKINKGTPGQPGGFLSDGADGQDGADRWFELSCYSIGPSFYEWSYYMRSVTVSPQHSLESTLEASRYRSMSH